MTLNIAIQMDDISSINYNSDSTLPLGMEAQNRGYNIFYYTPDKLSYKNGEIIAFVHKIKFFADQNHYYEIREGGSVNLRKMDVIFLRQDPPFNMTYLSTTYLLEQLQPDVLVVNDPVSVRNNPEKIFPTILKEFMPETLISADINEIRDFYTEYKDIVIKPLYGHGGRGILRLKKDDDNFDSLIEMLFTNSKEPIISQRFLPEVKGEDKRVIMIDGVAEGVFGRIPSDGNIRANMRVGGQVIKSELNKKQAEICEALNKPLQDKGIIFAGLDFIGNFLTEINITSPTGIKAVEKLENKRLEKNIWDAIEKRFYIKNRV
ncbi:MAG: glutathione synthase [Rickettsiales bacterium]